MLTPRLTGKLRMYVLGVSRTFEPGERAIFLSHPLEQAFQFRYVVVPEEVAFDLRTGEVRIVLHHEFMSNDHSAPASMILNPDTVDMQSKMYRKHVYKPGEVMEIGVFENVSKKSIVVRAGVVGLTHDWGVP